MVAFLVAVVPLMGSAVKVLRSPRALGVQTRVESVLVKACFPEPQRGQEATPSGQRRSRAHGKARSRPTGVDDGFLKCLACPWVRCTPLHSRRPVCDCPTKAREQPHHARRLHAGSELEQVSRTEQGCRMMVSNEGTTELELLQSSHGRRLVVSLSCTGSIVT